MTAARPAPLERVKDPLGGLTVLHGRTRRGMEVYVAPMKGFGTAHAVLATRYGSVDTHLPDGTPLPEGIAHFLEHKMFQTGDGDAFDVFDARGASSNAFTTFGSTAYLFSCTTRFEENLDTLLTMLEGVEVDREGIEREKGIIGQEIAMYDDDPGWRGYFNLLGALYRRHPVRVDIAGTRETIAPIDADWLRRTHAAFYHPRNLVLVAAGDIDARAVRARAEEAVGPTGARNRRAAVSEPRGVRRRVVEEVLPVGRPRVGLGLKDAPPGPRGLLRRQVESALALDVLFGDGGRVEAPLYDEGVVDTSFQASYEADADYGHAIVYAEVDDAEGYRRRLQAVLREAEGPVTADELRRSRRTLLGRRLRLFHSAESVAHWILGTVLEGASVGADVPILEACSTRSVSRRMRELLAAPRAWSVIRPRSDSKRGRASG